MIPRPPSFTSWEEEKRWAFANLPLGFPHLLQTGFTPDDVTSPRKIDYNCIAYAAKDETQWWWPTPLWMITLYRLNYHHWPTGLPRESPATVGNFIKAFERLGFKQCKSGRGERGYEKVAIFVDDDDVPTHMARELGDGIWHSKLGSLQDIRHHTLQGVNSDDYGSAKYFMRKPLEGYPKWKRIAGKLLGILSGSRAS